MVIVVGAGPAGATAARMLAQAGIGVRLLDRSAFPRNKPCGGAISLRALRRFPYLERELARIATHRVSRLYLEGPDGQSTLVESDGPAALMIRRVEFDALLVDLAVEAGVELVTGADIVRVVPGQDSVQLFARDGRTFEAPLVVAADGVNSVIARRLGINPGWPASSVALDMMEETPRTEMRDVDPSALWVAYGYDPSGGRTGRPGYAYVFPKREHVNVGIGYLLDYYRTSVPEAPYELQRGFVESLRRRGVLEGGSVKAHFTPFLIPVAGPLDPPGRDRVLVAGDAGGFVNGFTAEGIYYAMVSGELAARSIVQGSRTSPDGLVERYRRACKAELGVELRDAAFLQQYLFGNPRRIRRAIAGATKDPHTTREVLQFAVGATPYRALRRRLALRAPRVAAHLVWHRMTGRFLTRPRA
jgi:geranylgeranyl reductase family protein